MGYHEVISGMASRLNPYRTTQPPLPRLSRTSMDGVFADGLVRLRAGVAHSLCKRQGGQMRRPEPPSSLARSGGPSSTPGGTNSSPSRLALSFLGGLRCDNAVGCRCGDTVGRWPASHFAVLSRLRCASSPADMHPSDRGASPFLLPPSPPPSLLSALAAWRGVDGQIEPCSVGFVRPRRLSLFVQDLATKVKPCVSWDRTTHVMLVKWVAGVASFGGCSATLPYGYTVRGM